MPRDCVECLYQQAKGVLGPPSWHISLPILQHVSEDNEAWMDIQAQQGTHDYAVSRNLLCLEAVMRSALARAETDASAALLEAMALRDEINEQVVVPPAHTLCMVGEFFNDISTKRKRRLDKSVWDTAVPVGFGQDSPETLTSLFHDDMSNAMEVARAHHTDGLLSLASKAEGGSSILLLPVCPCLLGADALSLMDRQTSDPLICSRYSI